MNMSSLAEYNRREVLSDLWRKIESSHLSYLEHDEGPEKLKSRKKLEGYILEYLHLVPHEFKFGLTETATVLQRSIEELKNFSGYDACLGWQSIARYAANLLSQPWRKEYRTIRTYCGYYKHEVESNLIGAPMMLELMGYKNVGGGRLVMEGPICPDAVTAVSRDALIAYVHCQLLCCDWEAAWSQGNNVTWKQIALKRQQDANMFDEPKAVYSNSVPQKESPLVNYNQTYEHSSPVRLARAPSRQSRMHTTLPNSLPNQSRCIQDQYAHRTIPEYCLTDTPYTYAQPYYYGMTSQHGYGIQPQIYGHVNGYHNDVNYGVPTGQLIEIDYNDISSKRLEEERRIPRSDTQPALRDQCSGSYESWDYVFRNLETQEREKNTCYKDSRTLERHKERSSGRFQPMTMDLEDGLRAMSLDQSREEEMNRMARVNETLLKLKQSEARKKQKKIEEKKLEELRKQKRSMIEEARKLEEGRKAEEAKKIEEKRKLEEKRERKLEEIRKQKHIDNSNKMANGISDAKTIAGPKISPKPKMENGDARGNEKINGVRENGYNGHQESGSRRLVADIPEPTGKHTTNAKSSDEIDSSARVTSGGGKWNCKACTYLNTPNIKVCAMCGKSRDWDGSGTRLQSGGRECPACTLVNPRQATECSACSTNLNHSPTYI